MICDGKYFPLLFLYHRAGGRKGRGRKGGMEGRKGRMKGREGGERSRERVKKLREREESVGETYTIYFLRGEISFLMFV